MRPAGAVSLGRAPFFFGKRSSPAHHDKRCTGFTTTLVRRAFPNSSKSLKRPTTRLSFDASRRSGSLAKAGLCSLPRDRSRRLVVEILSQLPNGPIDFRQSADRDHHDPARYHRSLFAPVEILVTESKGQGNHYPLCSLMVIDNSAPLMDAATKLDKGRGVDYKCRPAAAGIFARP